MFTQRKIEQFIPVKFKIFIKQQMNQHATCREKQNNQVAPMISDFVPDTLTAKGFPGKSKQTL